MPVAAQIRAHDEYVYKRWVKLEDTSQKNILIFVKKPLLDTLHSPNLVNSLESQHSIFKFRNEASSMIFAITIMEISNLWGYEQLLNKDQVYLRMTSHVTFQQRRNMKLLWGRRSNIETSIKPSRSSFCGRLRPFFRWRSLDMKIVTTEYYINGSLRSLKKTRSESRTSVSADKTNKSLKSYSVKPREF